MMHLTILDTATFLIVEPHKNASCYARRLSQACLRYKSTKIQI